jgi:hypothetical protein
MHCRNTFDTHDARLGINRYFGELNAAEILTRNVHGTADAKAAVIVAALGNGADRILVEETSRLTEADVARGVAASKDSTLASREIVRLRAEYERRGRKQFFADLIGGFARRRRNRAGRLAAARTWTRRKVGVADAHRYILGSQSQFFGDDLRQQRADTAADVWHGRTQLNRAIAIKPGEKIFVVAGKKQPDGTIAAPSIVVGRNGVNPPM